MIRMQNIMADFRNGINDIAGIKINELSDYGKELDGLPKSNVLKFRMQYSSVVLRPSGTEPKLKTYIFVTVNNKEKAEEIENSIT